MIDAAAKSRKEVASPFSARTGFASASTPPLSLCGVFFFVFLRFVFLGLVVAGSSRSSSLSMTDGTSYLVLLLRQNVLLADH